MIVRLLGSATWLGAAGSVLGLSRMVIAYPVGAFSDRRGRKAGLYLGLVFSIVGSVLAGASLPLLSFPLFILGIFVFGLGVGAVQQLRVAAADMYPPDRRGEGLGYLLTGSLVGAVGSTALVSLAKACADAFGWDALTLSWLLVPALLFPCLYLVTRVRPDPLEIARNLGEYYPETAPAAPRVGAAPDVELTAFLRQFPMLVAFASTFAAQGNMVMIMAITALILDHHGHGLPTISLAVSIHVVGMFGPSLPLGWLADRRGRRPVLAAGALLSAAGSLLVVLTGHYAVISAGGVLVGVGWACANVAATALLSDTTTAGERGRAIGANDAIGGVANILLPLAAGPVAEALGLPAVGLVGAGLMMIPLAMTFWLRESSPGVYGVVAPPVSTAAGAAAGLNGSRRT
jgi:MFS family permease